MSSILNNSAVCASPGRLWQMWVFFQNQNGDVQVREHLDGTWGAPTTVCKAKPSSPLASCSWKDGDEQVRLYYIDSQNILQEYCYTSGKGWYPGEVGNLGVQAAQNTKIAAVEYGDSSGGVHLRVYCQESGSNAVKEFANDGSWFRAATLPAAASGSSIAAVAYLWKGLQLRVYTQTDGGSIQENALSDNSGWFVGDFSANAPRGASISAIGWNGPEDGQVQLQVYWLDQQNTIVYSKNTGSWGPPQTATGGLRVGLNFAAAQWDFGNRLRLYFQGPDERIHELYNDGSDVWQPGSLQ